MAKDVQMTTSSEKGQVVIPQEIRDALGIESRTKFAVYGKSDTTIFKRVEVPTVKDFEKLAVFGRKFAKKNGIRKKDVLQDD